MRTLGSVHTFAMNQHCERYSFHQCRMSHVRRNPSSEIANRFPASRTTNCTLPITTSLSLVRFAHSAQANQGCPPPAGSTELSGATGKAGSPRDRGGPAGAAPLEHPPTRQSACSYGHDRVGFVVRDALRGEAAV